MKSSVMPDLPDLRRLDCEAMHVISELLSAVSYCAMLDMMYVLGLSQSLFSQQFSYSLYQVRSEL